MKRKMSKVNRYIIIAVLSAGIGGVISAICENPKLVLDILITVSLIIAILFIGAFIPHVVARYREVKDNHHSGMNIYEEVKKWKKQLTEI